MNRLRNCLYMAALVLAVASVSLAQNDKERDKEKERGKKGSQTKSAPVRRGAEGRGEAPESRGRGTAAEPGRNPNVMPGREGMNGPGARPMGERPNAVNDRPGFRQTEAGGFRRPDVAHGGMVRTPGGAVVYHAPGGARRFVVGRPGGAVIVTNARGHGYMERPIVLSGGVRIVQRTYVVGGVPYVRVYRPLVYGGISFNVYTPMRFYTPGFYAWGYTPWARPVVYAGGFGWVGPGFGFYAGYFAPYPYYAGPNFWLTDYLIAASLQQAYQERMDAAAAAAGPPPYDPNGQTALSPQVKDQIAAEVQRDLAQERQQAENPQAVPSGPPPILDGNPHVFVVSASLIASYGGQQCALTEGDVLQLNRAPSPDPNYANVQVLASKAQDCRVNQIVPVQLLDLQDMQNNMRATIDQGMGEMQKRQNQGGLPPIDPSLRAQTPSPIAAEVPPPDPTVAAQLQQQAQDAVRQEEQALGGSPNMEPVAAPMSSPAPSGGSLQLGQTTEQVIAIMGKPASVAPGNGTKTYVYQDLRVTFTNGVVTDIQ